MTLNNQQLLWQAASFCEYSATHAETRELAEYYKALAEVFTLAENDFKLGRPSPYRAKLINAASYLNLDIASGMFTDNEDDPE